MPTLIDIMGSEIELIERLREIEQEIIDNEGEVDDALDEEYNAVLDALLNAEGQVEDKIDAYGAVMTELEQEIEGVRGREKPVKEVVENLRSRRKALQRNRERMKERIMVYLQELGIERIEGNNFRFRRQTNGGKRSVNVTGDVGPADVGHQYTYSKFDYDAIRNALKDLESLREEYDVLRKRYEQAKAGEIDTPAPEVAKEAKALVSRIEELEESVGEWAELSDRGEHIRKF